MNRSFTSMCSRGVFFFLYFFAVLSVGVPASSSAYSLHTRLRTIVTVYPDVRGNVEATLAPLYEFADIEALDVGVKGLEVVFSGWAKVETWDWWKEERWKGSLLYGYVRFRSSDARLDTKVGRMLINAGAAPLTLQMDGGYVSFSTKGGTSINLYTGIPLNDMDGSRKGDWLAGFRAGHRWGTRAELGVSYFLQKEREDVNFNRLGFDGWFHISPSMNITGYLSYDITYSRLHDSSVTFSYYPASRMWKLFAVEAGTKSAMSFLGNQSVLSVFASGDYANLKVSGLFEVSGVMVGTGYEFLMYADSRTAAHRIYIKAKRYFDGERYLLLLHASRLRSDTSYTELRFAASALILTSLQGNVDTVWDVFDEEVREDMLWSYESTISLKYELVENVKITAAVSIAGGVEYTWRIKGMGKLTYEL